MRRLLLISMAIIMAFSCRKAGVPDSALQLKVRIEAPSLKAVLGGENAGLFPVLWQAGDRISLNGVLSNAMSPDMAGNREAAFSFIAPDVSAPYQLLYPGTTTGKLTLDGSLIPMYAAGNSLDEVFVFHHLSCGVRLSLTGELSVSSIHVSAPGGEEIAGEFSLSGGSLSPSAASSSFTRVYPSPVQLSQQRATPFFFFIAPGTFSEGLLITAQSPEGVIRSWRIAGGATLTGGRLYLIPETGFASRDLSDGFVISLEQITEESIPFEL